MCHYKRQNYILNKIHKLDCSDLCMSVSPSFVCGELTAAALRIAKAEHGSPKSWTPAKGGNLLLSPHPDNHQPCSDFLHLSFLFAFSYIKHRYFSLSCFRDFFTPSLALSIRVYLMSLSLLCGMISGMAERLPVPKYSPDLPSEPCTPGLELCALPDQTGDCLKLLKDVTPYGTPIPVVFPQCFRVTGLPQRSPDMAGKNGVEGGGNSGLSLGLPKSDVSFLSIGCPCKISFKIILFY